MYNQNYLLELCFCQQDILARQMEPIQIFVLQLVHHLFLTTSQMLLHKIILSCTCDSQSYKHPCFRQLQNILLDKFYFLVYL